MSDILTGYANHTYTLHMGRKRCSYLLTEQQIEELKRLSQATGLTVSEQIRRAVDDYLRDHQVQAEHGEVVQLPRMAK